MSSAFIDMALAVGAPIVPVRFIGALPVEPLVERLEFPIGHGRQDVWIGRPIVPEELTALPFKDRKQAVLDAINGLGPPNAEEAPCLPDAAFSAEVEAWCARTGASPEHAALFQTLAHLPDPGAEITRLLDGARRGRLVVGRDAKGVWLGELARRLFGERGPEVTG
jgi:hypothetical protein